MLDNWHPVLGATAILYLPSTIISHISPFPTMGPPPTGEQCAGAVGDTYHLRLSLSHIFPSRDLSNHHHKALALRSRALSYNRLC